MFLFFLALSFIDPQEITVKNSVVRYKIPMINDNINILDFGIPNCSDSTFDCNYSPYDIPYAIDTVYNLKLYAPILVHNENYSLPFYDVYCLNRYYSVYNQGLSPNCVTLSHQERVSLPTNFTYPIKFELTSFIENQPTHQYIHTQSNIPTNTFLLVFFICVLNIVILCLVLLWIGNTSIIF